MLSQAVPPILVAPSAEVVEEKDNKLEQEKVEEEIKATQFVFKEMLLDDEETSVPTYDQLEVSQKLSHWRLLELFKKLTMRALFLRIAFWIVRYYNLSRITRRISIQVPSTTGISVGRRSSSSTFTTTPSFYRNYSFRSPSPFIRLSSSRLT